MKNISSTAPQTEILREIYYILADLTDTITSNNSDSSINQKSIYAKLDEIKSKISDISTGSQQTVNNNYYQKYIRNVQHNYIIQEEKYYRQPDPRWLALITSTPEPSLIPKYQESGVTRTLNPDYIQGQPARIFYKNYYCKNK